MEISLKENEQEITLEQKVEAHTQQLLDSGLKFIELAIRVATIEGLLIKKGLLTQNEIKDGVQEYADLIANELKKQ